MSFKPFDRPVVCYKIKDSKYQASFGLWPNTYKIKDHFTCSHLSINPVRIKISLQTQASLAKVCYTCISTNWTVMNDPLVTSLLNKTISINYICTKREGLRS